MVNLSVYLNRHVFIMTLFSEFCRIPSVTNGEVIGQKEHLVVPDGFRAYVKCFPLHKISSKHPMTCDKGKWKRIPRCTLGLYMNLLPTKPSQKHAYIILTHLNPTFI